MKRRIFTNRIQPFKAANISAASLFVQTNDEALTAIINF